MTESIRNLGQSSFLIFFLPVGEVNNLFINFHLLKFRNRRENIQRIVIHLLPAAAVFLREEIRWGGGGEGKGGGL